MVMHTAPNFLVNTSNRLHAYNAYEMNTIVYLIIKLIVYTHKFPYRIKYRNSFAPTLSLHYNPDSYTLSVHIANTRNMKLFK